MDKPISVGDLVMVVRGHECVLRLKGGIPWRVMEFSNQRGGGWHCAKCDTYGIAPEEKVAAVAPWNNKPGNGIPVGWLRRIPPPEELGIRTADEVPA